MTASMNGQKAQYNDFYSLDRDNPDVVRGRNDVSQAALSVHAVGGWDWKFLA